MNKILFTQLLLLSFVSSGLFSQENPFTSNYIIASLNSDGSYSLAKEKDKLILDFSEALKIADDAIIDCVLGYYEDGVFLSLYTEKKVRHSIGLVASSDKKVQMCSGTRCSTYSCAEYASKCIPDRKACVPCDVGTMDCKRSSSLIENSNESKDSD
jgi:hypothetical protein